MTATLAWILVLVTACSAGTLAYLLLERKRKAEPPLPTEWSLTPRPVFNEHERRVHRQLREALPQQVVLAKLPLVRFCQPTDPTQVRYWFELLGATHVSFAVCSVGGRVLAAIDLDDGRGAARRSVKIKQAVLAACHVRYVHYPPGHTPSVPELQLLVPASPAAAPTPAPAATVVMRTGFNPAAVNAEAFHRRARAASGAWPDSGHRKDSSFGRDSVISGFSNSLPSVMPQTDGEVVDAPAVRH